MTSKAPFKMIETEVNSDSYLQEFKEKVEQQIAVREYPMVELTEDTISKITAEIMIERNNNELASEADLEFFSKILWVVLDQNIGDYQYRFNSPIELKIKLRKIQMAVLSKKK